MQAPSHLDARSYLALWFLGAPYEAIRRGNLEDLIAYGFHYKSKCVCARSNCSQSALTAAPALSPALRAAGDACAGPL